MRYTRNPWVLGLIGLSLALIVASLLHAWYWAAVLREAPEQEGAYFIASICALVLGAPTSIAASLMLTPTEPLLVRFGISSLQFILGAMVMNWALVGFVVGWWNRRKAREGTPRGVSRATRR